MGDKKRFFAKKKTNRFDKLLTRLKTKQKKKENLKQPKPNNHKSTLKKEKQNKKKGKPFNHTVMLTTL